jgi:hypothetical protein
MARRLEQEEEPRAETSALIKLAQELFEGIPEIASAQRTPRSRPSSKELRNP